MSNSRVLYWPIQLTAWAAFVLMIGITVVIQGELKPYTIYQLSILYVLLILSSHTIRWCFIRFKWLNLSILKLLPRAIAVILLIASVQISITNLLVNHIIFGEDANTFIEFVVNVILNSIFFFLWSAVYFTYHLFRKSSEQELNNLKLQSRQAEIELKNLRDQLNPHFLFNSLNNIRALIEIDPAKAKSTITTLSGLLRSSLLSSKKTYIPLSEELLLVEQYLKLEKVRFEERLSYEITNEVKEDIFILPYYCTRDGRECN